MHVWCAWWFCCPFLWPVSNCSNCKVEYSSCTQDSFGNCSFLMTVLNTGLQRRTLGDNFDERLTATHSSFITTADNRFIFACGFWDKSFRLYFSETGANAHMVLSVFETLYASESKWRKIFQIRYPFDITYCWCKNSFQFHICMHGSHQRKVKKTWLRAVPCAQSRISKLVKKLLSSLAVESHMWNVFDERGEVACAR